MTKIEEVARAIYAARLQAGMPEEGFHTSGEQWRIYLPQARAAIEAMRDPPEYVLDAMNPSKRYASTVIPEAWNDAIDAALLDRK